MWLAGQVGVAQWAAGGRVQHRGSTGFVWVEANGHVELGANNRPLPIGKVGAVLCLKG
jgi:hypothetical protein